MILPYTFRWAIGENKMSVTKKQADMRAHLPVFDLLIMVFIP
jgi:hypothetical protein